MLRGEEVWSKIQSSLQQDLSKPSYETWIRPAQFNSFLDGELNVLAPNPFSSNYLRKHYLNTIEQLATKICGHPIKVIFNSVEEENRPL